MLEPKRGPAFKTVRGIIIGAFAFWSMLPIYWMVTMGFKGPSEWVVEPIHWLPQYPTLDNYRQVFLASVGKGDVEVAEKKEGGEAVFGVSSSVEEEPAGVVGVESATEKGGGDVFGVSSATTDEPEDAFGVPSKSERKEVKGAYYERREPATRSIYTSLIIGALSTLLALFIGTLAAYGISRHRAGGGSFPFFILQLRMFPPIAIIIPLFIMYSTLHLRDTYYGLILIYAGVTFPFVVWLMKSFFDEIPKELDEAAIADGCTRFQAFFSVVLPLVKGGFAATALFVFILNWSDFLMAVILTDVNVVTIPVQLYKYVSSVVGQLYGPKAALGTIAAIPVVIFGLKIQDYLVRGLTFGAIKR